jgi:hypothetical protein
MLRCVLFLTFALALHPGSADAHQRTFLGWPSDRAFNPYHPYRDSSIAFPTRGGPIPVHVRLYSVPLIPPYYNVPPYIVLDP